MQQQLKEDMSNERPMFDQLIRNQRAAPRKPKPLLFEPDNRGIRMARAARKNRIAEVRELELSEME